MKTIETSMYHGKCTCPDCVGHGVLGFYDPMKGCHNMTCPTCKGTGSMYRTTTTIEKYERYDER